MEIASIFLFIAFSMLILGKQNFNIILIKLLLFYLFLINKTYLKIKKGLLKIVND